MKDEIVKIHGTSIEIIIDKVDIYYFKFRGLAAKITGIYLSPGSREIIVGCDSGGCAFNLKLSWDVCWIHRL